MSKQARIQPRCVEGGKGKKEERNEEVEGSMTVKGEEGEEK